MEIWCDNQIVDYQVGLMRFVTVFNCLWVYSGTLTCMGMLLELLWNLFLHFVVTYFRLTMSSFSSVHIIRDMSFVIFSVHVRENINISWLVLMCYALVVESLTIMLVQLFVSSHLFMVRVLTPWESRLFCLILFC